MRIFYIGHLWQGSTSLQRFLALRDFAGIVHPFDTAYYFPPMYAGLHSVVRKLGFGPRLSRMNADIVAQVTAFQPDVVWVDKGMLVTPDTLRACRAGPQGPVLVSYSPDDMINPENQTRHYLRALSVYDVHITTKPPNVRELKALGAADVRLVNNCYHDALHRPVPINDDDRDRYGAKVGFIGYFEVERAKSLTRLADAGIKVRVWGSGWNHRSLCAHPNIKLEHRPLWGDDYVRVICATDINLGFLRKVNRDTVTQRSVEIPACGGFMLAERTVEHLALFTEREEAVYFGSDDELIEQVRYYSNQIEARKRIAVAGRERCLRSGYSYRKTLQTVLERIMENTK